MQCKKWYDINPFISALTSLIDSCTVLTSTWVRPRACLRSSLLLLPLADAITINQLKPPVTAIVAWIFLKEPLGMQGLLGCAVARGGVVVLAHPPFLFGGHGGWGRARVAGTLFGVVSPFFAAGVGYSTRRIGKSEPAVVVALW